MRTLGYVVAITAAAAGAALVVLAVKSLPRADIVLEKARLVTKRREGKLHAVLSRTCRAASSVRAPHRQD